MDEAVRNILLLMSGDIDIGLVVGIKPGYGLF
jgi:uncharacterized membrane protein